MKELISCWFFFCSVCFFRSFSLRGWLAEVNMEGYLEAFRDVHGSFCGFKNSLGSSLKGFRLLCFLGA